MEQQYIVVFITANSANEAQQIAGLLLEPRLAACVNIYPIKSIYWWEGKIEEEAEMAMLVKTKVGLVDEAIERVKELHSYEVPCIVSLPIEKGNPDYLKWIDEVTK